MSKYTPGPWFLVGNGDYDSAAISTDPDPHNNGEVLGSSEWLRAKEEDLRLMAAAPEMLQMLQAMSLREDILEDFPEMLHIIKKAKGE